VNSRTDSELLSEYAERGSEKAFGELVRRYVDLVYSAAVRMVVDRQLAEDVAQGAFIALAQNASKLTQRPVLSGWLHRTARNLAAKTVRTEVRRRDREHEAATMFPAPPDEESAWDKIVPLLDEVLSELVETDRDVLLLRYFERKTVREMAIIVGSTEEAAQKRVTRALERLREVLVGSGLELPSSVLVGAIVAKGVQATPAGLITSIMSASTSIPGIATTSVVPIFKAPSRAKPALVIGTAAIAILTAFLVWRLSNPGQQKGNVQAGDLQPVQETLPSAVAEGAAQPATFGKPDLALQPGAATETLALTIVAADSAKPIPNVPIDYRCWKGKNFEKQRFFANRAGVCNVPLSFQLVTELELITRIEGFADTRLHWLPKRGETIPTIYTLRLDRSVLISGRVVDSDGQPVMDAKVGFNHGQDPEADTRVESHLFAWIEVATGEGGRWEINRIAPEMIGRIYGQAKHPEHVSSGMIFTSRDPKAENEMREGTHVFRLGRAVVLHGLVVDSDGAPVPDAKVLVGTIGSSSRRETNSQANGTFTIGGCKPGKNLVSAEGGGFAATTREIEVTDESEPIRITLQRGKTLRLRVMDQAGQPVRGAHIMLETFPTGQADPKRPRSVQADFHAKTDAEGKAVWENAPDAELILDFQASGFMRVDGVTIQPDGKEHLVTLPPALVITGTVRDAENGQPIPRFRIITGWPSPDHATGKMNALWSAIDRFWLTFTGGEYRHAFEEPLVVGTENRGYLLKFEADGYAPFVSRLLGANEGEVRLDVILRPAAAMTVTVTKPDGRPAANADVGLVASGARLQIIPGGFSRSHMDNGGSLLTCDRQGQFRLPADDSINRVIVACADGYAEATRASLAADPSIRLQPWGRLEGTSYAADKPAAGRQFQLQFMDRDSTTVTFDFNAYRVETDADGHFAFPKAPPGHFRLRRLMPRPAAEAGATIWEFGESTEVEILPGKTSTVNPGRGGL